MWAKLTDNIFTDELSELSKDGKLLHLAGLAACAAKLTDGYLSPASLRIAAASVDVGTATAGELVAAGLWEERPEGAFFLNTYLRDNPSAEQVARKRATRAARGSTEYRAWRKAVLERDDFRCARCGDDESPLEAHHIKSFASHPELRYDVTNGTTLCGPCHTAQHSKGAH